MTVAQNIGFGLADVGQAEGSEIAARVSAKMLATGAHSKRLKDRKHQRRLSGGQQQRVALAGRWRRAPRCCCLMSRSRRWTYKLRKEMQIELKRLQHETGITFILRDA
jgi:spermidine/putrescine transport system ATP-binding protein